MYSDDDLVRKLSEVINRTIDHPVDTRRLADAAFSLRSLDAELAVVTFDSALEPAQSAGTRAAGTDTRHLRFEFGEVVIELDLEGDDNATLELTGVLQPPSPATIAVFVRSGEFEATATVDAFGRFAFDGVPHGPMQLHLDRPDAGAIRTDVLTI
jgi:hypothetical protein